MGFKGTIRQNKGGHNLLVGVGPDESTIAKKAWNMSFKI